MAIKQLSTSEANALAGTTLSNTGAPIPAIGDSSYTDEIHSAMNQLDLSAASWLRVVEIDGNADAIGVLPGRLTIEGQTKTYAGDTDAGGAVDGLTDDDTTYIWAYLSGGSVTIGSAIDGTGWPSYPHVKLAEVTMASGVITAITDRRAEAIFTPPLEYKLEIETQGDTGSPSRIHIQATNATDYLRVRVCDDGDFDNATNATIAAAGNTTLVETMTTSKDLVFKSHTDGQFEIDLTDATAETVTLRIGPAPLSPRMAQYTATLDVTHAAP